MTIPFGPELVGRTEKTLQALLRRTLQGADLSEPEWVTLRVAESGGGGGDLAALVHDRARFDDAHTLVSTLTERGLLSDGALTDDGRAVIAGVRERTTAQNGGLWDDLPEADVAAAERVLNELLERARGVLARV
jgi:hypothetical protein